MLRLLLLLSLLLQSSLFLLYVLSVCVACRLCGGALLRVFVADAAAAVVSVLVCCPLLFGLFLVAVGAWRSGAWGFGMWRSALGVRCAVGFLRCVLCVVCCLLIGVALGSVVFGVVVAVLSLVVSLLLLVLLFLL